MTCVDGCGQRLPGERGDPDAAHTLLQCFVGAGGYAVGRGCTTTLTGGRDVAVLVRSCGYSRAHTSREVLPDLSPLCLPLVFGAEERDVPPEKSEITQMWVLGLALPLASFFLES